jgi:hypothetical protein
MTPPCLRGYAALGADLFGSMLPMVATTAISGGSAVAGAMVGGLQGGGNAARNARDLIDEMARTPANPTKYTDETKIERQSAYYRELIASGKTPSQALAITKNAAERYVGALSRGADQDAE